MTSHAEPEASPTQGLRPATHRSEEAPEIYDASEVYPKYPEDRPEAIPPQISKVAPEVVVPVRQYKTAVPLASLTSSPAPVDCPGCGTRAFTVINYRSGDQTHIWGAVFCITMCAPCFAYIGTCFKDVEHRCGHCNALLALWHKGGGVDVLLYD